ncbi:MAG: RDD family protein [Candidatus Korobacteraceae bacterium]|jgi:uncharacterized RDD family membrane protein YckC
MEAAVQQVCSNCGNPLLPDGKFCLFCGDVLAAAPDKPMLVTRASRRSNVDETLPAPEYAGFWLRVWAGAIDIAVEALAALVLTVIVGIAIKIYVSQSGLSPITGSYLTGIAFIFLLAVGAWLYCAFMESSKWRATIGKRILGLQVVTSSGGKLSFGQASVRHFMKFLSLFTAGVGFMMAGWTKRCQALHDIPSDSVVIKIAEPSLSLFGKQS